MINRALESRWLFTIHMVLLAVIALSVLVPMAAGIHIVHQAECPWRVSSAGMIHGPDSPYRGMVPPSRCYATETEAREAAGL